MDISIYSLILLGIAIFVIYSLSKFKINNNNNNNKTNKIIDNKKKSKKNKKKVLFNDSGEFTLPASYEQVVDRYAELLSKNKNIKHNKNISYLDETFDNKSWDNNSDIILPKEELNKNYIDNQFHNDYRDVITAFNNIIPDKKQIFNIPNQPLKYSEPMIHEVKLMVIDFVQTINNNLVTSVPNNRNANSGWDEAIPDPNINSGWEDLQNELGLPTSLYEEPASKALVKLIDIQNIEKYETEDEIKYNIKIVIQKLNVDDQMIIKSSFIQDKRPLHDENNFLENKTVKLPMIIEDIFVIGYLSNEGDDKTKQYDGDNEKWFDYDKLEKNNMTDPKYIQNILMEKYKEKAQEMEHRNVLLDEEGQDFHRGLSKPYEYENIKATQTIFDDMNSKNIYN